MPEMWGIVAANQLASDENIDDGFEEHEDATLESAHIAHVRNAATGAARIAERAFTGRHYR